MILLHILIGLVYLIVGMVIAKRMEYINPGPVAMIWILFWPVTSAVLTIPYAASFLRDFIYWITRWVE